MTTPLPEGGGFSEQLRRDRPAYVPKAVSRPGTERPQPVAGGRLHDFQRDPISTWIVIVGDSRRSTKRTLFHGSLWLRHVSAVLLHPAARPPVWRDGEAGARGSRHFMPRFRDVGRSRATKRRAPARQERKRGALLGTGRCAVSAYSCHSKIGSRIVTSRYRCICRLFSHEWGVKYIGSTIVMARYQTPHSTLSPSWAFIDRQDGPSSSLMRLCSIRPIRALCIILQDHDWPSSRRA